MASAKELQHIILLYVAAILLIIAVATNYWISSWHTSLDNNAGLFKICVAGFCGKHGGLEAVQTMEVLGVIAAVICAVAMTVHHSMKSNSNVKQLPKIVFFLSIAGAILVFLGCAKFGYDHFESDMYPHFSFFVAIIGGIVLIVGGVASSKK